MALIFKHGPLTSTQEYSARRFIDEYPYCVLLSGVIDYQWIEQNLLTFDHEIESGSSGELYTRKTRLYGMIRVTSGVLYFFYDKRDYDTVITKLPELVIASVPFMSSI